MANIPTEVVESCILPKLPVKSLIRFKSVSKSWKTLISSSNFLHLHHHHANRLLLIPVFGHTLLRVHNLDSPLHPSFLCPYPDPGPDPYPNKQRPRLFPQQMTILASCEFFVLVGYVKIYKVERLFLLNPSTLSYHRIIPLDVEQLSVCSEVIYGLYFDKDNDDCKVVRMAGFYSIEVYGWKIRIYSCKTNSWKLIEHKLISDPYRGIDFNSVECVHNNLLYVISDSSIDLRIRCFDIQAEQWTNDILFPYNLKSPIICILDESLCVLGENPIDDEQKDRDFTYYSMWVLNENGGKESWVKLMSIFSKASLVPTSSFRPIAYRKGSRHKLLIRRSYNKSELFWCDLKRKIVTKAEFNGRAGLEGIDHICKESLFSFSRWSNESYIKSTRRPRGRCQR